MCTSTAQAREIWVAGTGACRDCALVAVPCAFAHGSLFVASARETSCFGGPKLPFRDRCKGSELFCFDMQFSWQVQHFGHGGDRRGALIS